MDENHISLGPSPAPDLSQGLEPKKKPRNITAKFFAIPGRNQREITAKNRACALWDDGCAYRKGEKDLTRGTKLEAGILCFNKLTFFEYLFLLYVIYLIFMFKYLNILIC